MKGGEGMALACWLVLLTGAYPLWRAWRACAASTLRPALVWAVAAWLAWAAALTAAALAPARDPLTLRYLALGLTACALVAVLGARRPIVRAWNFVLLGLLAVLLLPLAEGLGTLRLNWPSWLFLAGTLAVGLLNYLPTRLGPAVLVLGGGCAVALADVLPAASGGQSGRQLLPVAWLLVALAPWVAYAVMGRRPAARAEFDALWLGFRDRFGLVWGQRLREQFNRAAEHAGWPVVLRWGGLRLRPGAAMPGTEAQAEMVATLRAMLKRFGPEDGEPINRPACRRGPPARRRRSGCSGRACWAECRGRGRPSSATPD